MSEPDWQPTVQLRWRKWAPRPGSIDHVPDQAMWSDKAGHWYILEQLWTREDYLDYEAKLFHPPGHEWRCVPVAE